MAKLPTFFVLTLFIQPPPWRLKRESTREERGEREKKVQVTPELAAPIQLPAQLCVWLPICFSKHLYFSPSAIEPHHREQRGAANGKQADSTVGATSGPAAIDGATKSWRMRHCPQDSPSTKDLFG
jgi:hypothetical protein